MAETLISPGVFTRENDLSFLPQGIAQIGAVVVGPTEKGRAFEPIVVDSQNKFLDLFGGGTYYTPYAVQNYLKNAGRVTIIRILGLSGYRTTMLPLHISGSVNKAAAVLAVSNKGAAESFNFGTTTVTGNVGDFILTLKTGEYYSSSFDSSKEKYITAALGTDPKDKTRSAYVFLNFPSYQEKFASNTAVKIGTSGSITFGQYSDARTPYIVSQPIGDKQLQLFRFKTISHGISANTEVKVGIFNVKFANEVPGSDYGTFSVTVRKYTDTDARQVALETFNNLTLDPNSINYLPRAIGDRYTEFDSANKLVYKGDYPNKSKYIRVEMVSNHTTLPQSAVPFGFQAYTVPYNSPSVIPTMSYVTTQSINGESNTRGYAGFNFSNGTAKAYNTYLPLTGATTGSNVGFNLWNHLTGNSGSLNNRKFIVGLQGGFDGGNPTTLISQGSSISASNAQSFDCSSATASGTLSYRRALDLVNNPDEIDVNLVLMPGILHSLHPTVTNYAINICEDRGDCFYIMDSSQLTDSIATAVSNVESLDTNYAATYFPWVKIIDPNTSRPFWVPPSVVVVGVYSFSDQIGEEWFAPAGLNRGGIPGAVEAYSRLNADERDELYAGRVNPMATFPGAGVTVWGQKTLQLKASALDRVNVRRLLISLKKFIASTSRYLVFEQNVSATRNRFLNTVNPYLESVQQRQGLYGFRVVMDETNNTPDIIDRNQLYGQIYIQPARAAEFIILDFNILPTGASFGG